MTTPQSLKRSTSTSTERFDFVICEGMLALAGVPRRTSTTLARPSPWDWRRR